ncbi:MAG: ECF transporter S component [Anaerolineae bacterium]|nr:ECF transporter S component [Anaerolineae bacterium]
MSSKRIQPVAALVAEIERIRHQIAECSKRIQPASALVAVAAVMIGVTILFTLVVRVPFAPTGGYFNFSDVAVYFAAFAFGPWMGLVAGGVGTALADIIGGYLQFAPLTFLAHGLEGLVTGYVGHKLLPEATRGGSPLRRILGITIGWALGAIVMLSFYFVGEAFIYGMGVIAAGGEALSINIPQVIVGGLVGIPLVLAVRRAYPPIMQIGQRREWREE